MKTLLEIGIKAIEIAKDFERSEREGMLVLNLALMADFPEADLRREIASAISCNGERNQDGSFSIE